METAEFRLKNVCGFEVKSIYGEGLITKISDGEVWINEIMVPLKYLKPTQLTNDWFIKFGFKKGHSSYHDLDYWERYGFKFLIRDQGDGEYTPCTHTDFLYSAGARFRHVHKLQNFYYAFKNEELTFIL